MIQVGAHFICRRRALKSETASSLNAITDIELFSRIEEKIPFIWDKFIFKGRLHLVSAFMKYGKTELLSGLCKAILLGDYYLSFGTKQSKILYLTEECTGDIRRRFEKLDYQPTGNLLVHGRDSGFLSLDPPTIENLKLYLIANGIEVLVIDTASKFLPIENENDASQVTAAVKPLLDLAGSTGAAVILVHHDRKSEGDGGRQIRGSGALFALVDQALLLSKPQGGTKTQRVLKTLGRFSESPEELLLDYVDGRYVSLGNPEMAETADAAGQIWDALEDGPRTIKEIVEGTEFHERKVRRILDKLQEEGLVKRTAAGQQGGGFRYAIIEPKEV